MDDDDARLARDRRRREDLLAGLRLETRLREANPPSRERAAAERQRRHDRIAGLLRSVAAESPDTSYIDRVTAGLLRDELARLEGPDAGPSVSVDPIPDAPLIRVERGNTILYCADWRAVVDFYRDDLRLPVTAEKEWFVEFVLHEGARLSIADASRATISGVDGQGITLSWKVTDVAATRSRLVGAGLHPTEVRTVWDATAFYLFDPEGHRIEVWSPGTVA